jgi:tetratricopeptide (TPR) repeat protein
MFNKKSLIVLLAIAAVLASASFGFGQTTDSVAGKVVLKKTDGTSTPVEGATVDIYRTDIDSGKPPAVKTDKDGVFTIPEIPVGQVFAIAIGGPGLKSEVYPNITAGMEAFLVELSAGDGKLLTEAQVRGAAKASATTGLSADEKKKREELLKKTAEISAKNEKAKNVNQTVNRVLTEGKKAFDGGDYTAAIAKFDEGINADPEYAGTAPVLYNNKAAALKLRAFNNYKKAIADKDNKASIMESVKADFTASIAASEASRAVLKTATSNDPEVKKNYDLSRYTALATETEVYRLMVATKADQSKAKDAIPVFEEYMAVETDSAKKAKSQLTLADILREGSDCDTAIPQYRKVLEMTPDSPDGMAGLGLCLFAVGASTTPPDKAKEQEGLNLMEKFAQTAPDTHPLKASVRESVDYLKTQEKLTPQKVTTTKKGKQ